jgi:hypothetical protein
MAGGYVINIKEIYRRRRLWNKHGILGKNPENLTEEGRSEMLRKILVGLAGLALGLTLLSCQSDETVQGPIIHEEDLPIVYGLVYTNAGPCPYALVYATDLTLGEIDPFDMVQADEDGWYYFSNYPLLWKYKEEHDILLEAYPGGLWYGSVVITYGGPGGRQDIYCQYQG